MRKDLPILYNIIQKSFNAISEEKFVSLRNKWISVAVSQKPDQSLKIELTEEEKAFLADHPVVKVSNEMDWPPFDFAAGKTPMGYSIDLLSIIAARIGIKIEFINGYTWDELWKKFEQKELDMVHPIYRTEYRERFGQYTKPLYYGKTVFITLKNQPEIQGIDDLKGQKLAAMKEWAVTSYLQTHHPEIELLMVDNLSQGLDAVGKGDAFALAELGAVAGYMLKKEMRSEMRINGQFKEYDSHSNNNLHYVIRKDWPIFHQLFSKAQDAITPQDLKELQEKWFGMDKDQTPRIHLTRKEQAFLKDHPIIQVSNETDWPPFDFTIGNQPQGYAIDILNLCAKRIGIQLAFVNGFTWNQLMNQFKLKKLDVIQPVFETLERQDTWLLSQPIYAVQHHFITTENNPDINNIKQLYGKIIAVGKGWTIESYLADNHPQIRLLSVSNMTEAFKCVSQGQASAAIETEPVARYLIKKHFFHNLKIGCWFKEFDQGQNKTLHMMFHKHMPQLKTMFDKALTSLPPGEMEALEIKWFGKTEAADQTKLKTIFLTPQEKAYLQQKEAIRMCVDPSWMPFEQINENAIHEGMAADIIKILSQRIGKPILLVPTQTWGQSIEYAQKRRCDILSLVQETPERKKYLNFTSPYISVPNVIVTRNNELFVDNIERILDKRFAIVKGYALADTLRNRYPKILLVEVNNMTQGLAKVRSKEAYGFIDTLPSLSYHLPKHGVIDLKIAGKLDNFLNLGIGIRNDDPVLLSIFQKAVSSLTEDEKQRITNKWISVTVTQGFNYALFWKILAGLFVVMVGFFYWNRRLSHLNHKIKMANEQIEAATKAKSQFLAHMSHEIRTPMNAILGMADFLWDSDITTEQKQFVGIIRNAGNSLVNIINDILDLSKVENGCLQLENIDFNLIELVEKTCEILALKVHQKGIELLCDIHPDTPVYLIGDPTRLQQLLTNLVGNAVKFTEKGEIAVEVKEYSSDNQMTAVNDNQIDILFSVRDTGFGIPNEAQKFIFDRFKQADVSTSRNYGGTGLGLAICKKIVEIMGGRIWVDSEPGKGSTFFFTCRFATQPPEKQESIVIPPEYHGLSVLIVDDNENNRRILSRRLTSWGCQITSASDEHTALEAIKNETFTLILVDVMMQSIDGLQTARKIKKHSDRLDNVALMLTSLETSEYCLKANELGVPIKLAKPIKQKDLINCLDIALGKKPATLMEQSQKETAPKESKTQPLKILLVEDNHHNQLIFKINLNPSSTNYFWI